MLNVVIAKPSSMKKQPRKNKDVSIDLAAMSSDDLLMDAIAKTESNGVYPSAVLDLLRKGLERWPSSVKLAALLSELLRCSETDAGGQEREEIWKRVGDAALSSADAALELGLVRHDQERYEEALPLLDVARKTKKAVAFAFYAMTLTELQRIDEALESLTPEKCPVADDEMVQQFAALIQAIKEDPDS